MIKVTIDQAAAHFAHWISLIDEGEEVMVLEHERPVARITRCEPSAENRPRVGTVTSAPVRCTEDCFAPMTNEELKDWGL
jgi:antitoxin (DNA-binding transcriptional repressor) of toxin-antitoxin stability system